MNCLHPHPCLRLCFAVNPNQDAHRSLHRELQGGCVDLLPHPGPQEEQTDTPNRWVTGNALAEKSCFL